MNITIKWIASSLHPESKYNNFNEKLRSLKLKFSYFVVICNFQSIYTYEIQLLYKHIWNQDLLFTNVYTILIITNNFSKYYYGVMNLFIKCKLYYNQYNFCVHFYYWNLT